MKTVMFLLVSAVTLLVSSAVPSPARHKPDDNLKDIIDTIDISNKSRHLESVVEDLEPLVDDGCKDKFFCKVYHILHKHEHFGKVNTEERIVKNLEHFIKGLKTNCTEEVKEVKEARVYKTIPKLVEHLYKCSQHRNLNMSTTSNN